MQQPTVIPWYRAGKRTRIILWVLILFLILAMSKIYLDVFSVNVTLKYASGKTYLKVYSDKNISRLYNEIERGYYLNNPASFIRLSKLIKLEQNLKPGRYLLQQGMSNFDLLKVLFKGRQEPVDVVFKYAERIENLCSFFGQQLEADSMEMLAMLKDPAVINKMGFDSATIIGMFIPNTYNFYWNTGSTALLERMSKEYHKFWTAERIEKALLCQLSQIQVSTLASIVQKESNKADEMPVIAGVYLNRMKLGMPLQADPTIIFAWNDPTIRRVTNMHTALASPYNTYQNLGLPPGPICTPSIQAIDAVLNYTQHNYLYFCAREDFSGYHAFAHTFEQHQENARRYQRELNKRQIQ